MQEPGTWTAAVFGNLHLHPEYLDRQVQPALSDYYTTAVNPRRADGGERRTNQTRYKQCQTAADADCYLYISRLARCSLHAVVYRRAYPCRQNLITLQATLTFDLLNTGLMHAEVHVILSLVMVAQIVFTEREREREKKNYLPNISGGLPDKAFALHAGHPTCKVLLMSIICLSPSSLCQPEMLAAHELSSAILEVLHSSALVAHGGE